jgi:hypothetical protein
VLMLMLMSMIQLLLALLSLMCRCCCCSFSCFVVLWLFGLFIQLCVPKSLSIQRWSFGHCDLSSVLRVNYDVCLCSSRTWTFLAIKIQCSSLCSRCSLRKGRTIQLTHSPGQVVCASLCAYRLACVTSLPTPYTADKDEAAAVLRWRCGSKALAQRRIRGITGVIVVAAQAFL